MKRSILLAVLTLFVAVSASAQRKVLIEEFTSSTCGPCAGTDPLMEEFEVAYHDKIVVLKYHQNYPAAGDIMYTAYPEGFDRGNLYSVHQTGIPWVQFNGVTNKNPGFGLDTLTSITDRVMDLSPVYYNLGVTQQITADSIIASITVNSGAAIDPEARLVVVIAEANVLHQGSNGRMYHTAAVRYAIPGFATDGTPTGSPLNVAANSQGTFRFAAKLKSQWNLGLLQVVAFVQNPTSKMVMGVETNKPSVFVERDGSYLAVVGSSTENAHWKVRNAGTTSQSVKLTSTMSKTAPYTSAIRDLQGNDLSVTPIALAPGEEKQVVVSITTSGANIESQNYSINIATADNVGITGAAGLAFPGDAKNVFIDAGVGSYQGTYLGAPNYRSALTKALGTSNPLVTLAYADMNEAFPSLNRFENIFWASGYGQGIYPGVGDLTQSDTNKIRGFISNGGNIAFSSMTMAGAFHDAGWGDFVEEIFGVIADPALNGTWDELIGIESDILGQGFTGTGITGMGASMPLEVSTVNPTSRAAFMNNIDEIVGVHTDHTGGGKALYMAFEPGNISTRSQREAIVKRIVDWFNGTLDVAPSTEKNGIVLKQNYPNPFNPGTTFGFELPESGRVTLTIQDMMGREVATVLESEHRNAGANIAHFNASDLASGNYVYVLTVNGVRIERKMTLAK